jgi:uncharacterized membrane protein (DUF373 family)
MSHHGQGRGPPTRQGSGVRARDVLALEVSIGGAETLIYVAVAVLLVLAAGFTFVGTVTDLVEGRASRQIADAGAFLLDRVLLLFIIAELLYTLRIVNFGGRILVEPFLFIGLIAVVRKVLVVAAEAAQRGTSTTDVVLQVAALSGLALVLSLAIFRLRRSAPAGGPEPR